MSHIPHLINGERVAGTGRTAAVFNPSTGDSTSAVGLADRATLQLAIDAAKAAFPAWRNTPPAKRAQIMFRFKQLLEQHENEIAALISAEHGKTLEDAVGELKRGIENVEFACAAPEILKGEYSRNVGPNIDAWTDLQPVGVVGLEELLGVDPVQVDPDIVRDAAVDERLVQALVGVEQARVLAHDRDRDLALGPVQPARDPTPGTEVRHRLRRPSRRRGLMTWMTIFRSKNHL